MIIKIDDPNVLGYRKFTDFNDAIKFCEAEYGYEGPAWECVKQTKDFYELESFLNEDGVFAEVEETE
jgi:hypothetical protein